MKHACEQSGGHDTDVRVYTGQNGARVCNVSGRNDVRHIVEIRNLLLYPAELTCRGDNNAAPRAVKFASSGPSDTDSTWTKTRTLAQGGCCTVDHVTVARNAYGSDSVITTVTARWPGSGLPDETVVLHIDVTANP